MLLFLALTNFQLMQGHKDGIPCLLGPFYIVKLFRANAQQGDRSLQATR